MTRTVLRYGGLLGLFLILLETARRGLHSFELYAAVVAVTAHEPWLYLSYEARSLDDAEAAEVSATLGRLRKAMAIVERLIDETG